MHALTVAQTSDGPPRPLELYRRRWTACFALPLSVLGAGWGLFAAYLCATLIDSRLGLALAGLAIFGSLPIAWTFGHGAWQTLTSTGPALLIDERGISHFGRRTVFVAWEDVERFSTRDGDGPQLGLWLKPSDRSASGWQQLSRGLRRALNGADVQIYLGDIAHQPKALDEALAAGLRHARAAASTRGARPCR